MVKAGLLLDQEVIGRIAACNNGLCNYWECAGWHGGAPGYAYNPDGPVAPHWANIYDLAVAMCVPVKVMRAKIRKLLAQGKLSDGCWCGCRGDLIAFGTIEHHRFNSIPLEILGADMPLNWEAWLANSN